MAPTQGERLPEAVAPGPVGPLAGGQAAHRCALACLTPPRASGQQGSSPSLPPGEQGLRDTGPPWCFCRKQGKKGGGSTEV